jgi:hypothetical protein
MIDAHQYVWSNKELTQDVFEVSVLLGFWRIRVWKLGI